MRTDSMLRKAGIAVVTGAVVLSTLAAPAIAEDAAEPPSGVQVESMGEAPGGQGGGGDMGGMGGGMGGEAPDGQGGGGGMGGADTMTYDYTGALSGVLVADGAEVASDGETSAATETDQNAALVQNGGTLAITDGELTKSGDDTNGDNCNFYGINSILLSVGAGSLATISGSSLSATSEGSNAIFATDSGTVYANDVTISTKAGNSRALDATYGGTIVAADITASTEGDHCATVATDRGGGSVSVCDSALSTAGSGSPILYSTGDIQVSGINATASGSQIAGMEGLNTILINDSKLTSTITKATASDPVANGVIIYQSTSGDAEASTGEAATFQVADSELASSIESGSMFYLTNTSANVVVCRTELDFDSSAANLLLAAGNDANSWGSAGSNGATVTFTAIEQGLAGTIEADTISSVDVYLTESSTWTGKAVISDNASASTSEAPLTVSIDATSAWVVTEDCTVSALTVAEGGQVVDEEGETVTVVAEGDMVYAGDSDVTVTVVGSYSTDYDASAAGTLSEDLIDRSAFDEAFGSSTAWAMGDSAPEEPAAEEFVDDDDADVDADDGADAVEEDVEAQEEAQGPLEAFISWLRKLFGL